MGIDHASQQMQARRVEPFARLRKLVVRADRNDAPTVDREPCPPKTVR
jgi:hypothetical protein